MANIRRLVLCPGDVNGIGPEICAKALAARACQVPVIILCPPEIFLPLALRAGLDDSVRLLGGSDDLDERSSIQVLDPAWWLNHDPLLRELREKNSHNIDESFSPGTIQARAGLLAFAAVVAAHRLISSSRASMVLTGCINKESLRAAGVPYIGHTEMFAGLSGVNNPLTMFQTGTLRIFFLTRHVSLRAACDLVTTANIVETLRSCDAAMERLSLVSRRIAVAGLNPHCGEHGLFGHEEEREIIPAIEAARELGIDAYGPVGADSVFHQAREGRYDAVLSLYHDQGHIAAKTLEFYRTITLTLGLPYLRISVDHGTAFDIAGTWQASPVSFIAALEAAESYMT